MPVFVGYPAAYRVGMSNLGLHFVYSGLRRSPSLRVERFFLDTAPRTFESGAPLSAAAALFFSVSYEEDYLNLARILLRSGVQPFVSDRKGLPLVFVGGPAVSANPFPLAEIADVIALGEGEETLVKIVEVLSEPNSSDRPGLLAGLAGIPGVFVPSEGSIGVSYAPYARHSEFTRSVISTPYATFPDTMLVEIARGCPGSCSFCLATAIYGPYRPVALSRLERYITSAMASVRRVGLVSTAVAAHPEFVAIMEMLARRKIAASLGSLRAEDLDGEKIEVIGSSGTRSVSMAPEVGGEEDRFRLGKRVPNNTYFNAAAGLRRYGVSRFTLYMLAGYPGEGPGHTAETRSFLSGFKEAVGDGRVSVHINPLVPKAWTPSQFHAMDDPGLLAEKIDAGAGLCRELGLVPRTKSVRSAVRQAVISLGDEKVGRAVVRYAGGGISWKKALEAEGADLRSLHIRKEARTEFPWDAIGGPVEKRALWGRFKSMVG